MTRVGGHDDPLGLQGHRAGLVSRSVAAVIDLAVVSVIHVLLQVGAGITLYLLLGPPFALPNPPPLLATVEFVVIAISYLTWGWTTSGRSLGDQVMGLRVVSRSGRRLGLTRSALRAALCVVFPAGLIWVVLSRRSASVQDLLIYSVVIYDWRYRPIPEDAEIARTPL